jgi:NAD(P)H dehydrogenase (quinone)
MTQTYQVHVPTTGRAHWVYAHPGSGRVNSALLSAGREALAEQHDVTVSDLYADGFNPALGPADFGGFTGETGNLVELTGDAYARGEVPADVRGEQDKLADAELLVLQFPLWSYGPPAMMKGWIDRVFQSGFAQGEMDAETGLPLRYGDGQLTRRKALIIVTAGDDSRTLGPRGLSGDIDSLLFPLTHGALWYVGIEALDLHVVYDADSLDGEALAQEQQRLVDRIRGLPQEQGHPYRRLRDGDYGRRSRALREDVLPGRTDLMIHRAP